MLREIEKYILNVFLFFLLRSWFNYFSGAERYNSFVPLVSFNVIKYCMEHIRWFCIPWIRISKKNKILFRFIRSCWPNETASVRAETFPILNSFRRRSSTNVATRRRARRHRRRRCRRAADAREAFRWTSTTKSTSSGEGTGSRCPALRRPFHRSDTSVWVIRRRLTFRQRRFPKTLNWIVQIQVKQSKPFSLLKITFLF